MDAGKARGRSTASRIVRIAGSTGPWLVAATVLATVALAVPRAAWLPRQAGRATSGAWEIAPDWPLDTIVALQVWLGGWTWPSDVVIGAIVVAAICAAAAAAFLSLSLRRTGLPPGLAALLALVAGSAPLASWSGSSPLGVAPVCVVSTALLLLLTRQPGNRNEGQASARHGLRVALVIAAAR